MVFASDDQWFHGLFMAFIAGLPGAMKNGLDFFVLSTEMFQAGFGVIRSDIEAKKRRRFAGSAGADRLAQLFHGAFSG